MSVATEVKPFPVISGKYLFYFTPADEGGFSVTCQNVFGVNAQGDTFEEALADAMSCAAFAEECHRDFADLIDEPSDCRRGIAVPRHREIKTQTIQSICENLCIPVPDER